MQRQRIGHVGQLQREPAGIPQVPPGSASCEENKGKNENCTQLSQPAGPGSSGMSCNS